MIKAGVLLLILCCSLKAFSASHVLPKDFLNPVIEIGLTPEGPFELLKVKSNYTAGRDEANPIVVFIPKGPFYQELPLFIRFQLTAVNKSGHILLLNASVKDVENYYGLEMFKGSTLIGGYSSRVMAPVIERAELCYLVDCLTQLENGGLLLNFFLDEKSRVGSSRALPLFDRRSLNFLFRFSE
jgi:hypothetical protein